MRSRHLAGDIVNLGLEGLGDSSGSLPKLLSCPSSNFYVRAFRYISVAPLIVILLFYSNVGLGIKFKLISRNKPRPSVQRRRRYRTCSTTAGDWIRHTCRFIICSW